jgi:ABC-type multidrug transport system fused ATPase/permease subunit
MKQEVAVAKKQSRYELFKRLLKFIKPEMPRITIGLIALIVNSITNLSFPWLIGKALDTAASESFSTFLKNSAGVFFAGSLASWIRIYCLGTATESIANRLKFRLFQSILYQDMDFYESTPLGEIVSLLDNDIQSASELFTEKIAGGLRSTNSAVNGSVLLYRTSPLLCGVSLSVVPVVGIAAMTLSRYSRVLTNRLRDMHSKIHSYSLERYQNISTVRLNNRETYEMEKFSSMLSESGSCSNKRHNVYGSFMSFVNLSTNCSLIAVLRVGGAMIARGELSMGDLTAFAIQVRRSFRFPPSF